MSDAPERLIPIPSVEQRSQIPNLEPNFDLPTYTPRSFDELWEEALNKLNNYSIENVENFSTFLNLIQECELYTHHIQPVLESAFLIKKRLLELEISPNLNR
jgi:hypothetical protein